MYLPLPKSLQDPTQDFEGLAFFKLTAKFDSSPSRNFVIPMLIKLNLVIE